MKNKTIIFILGMFLLSFVFAQQTSLGTFKQGEDVVLTQGCINSTYSNITLILFPNSTISMSGQIAMTGDDFYYYTYTNTDALGQYLVYGHCNEGGTDTAWVYDFQITPTGNEANVTDSYLVFTLIGFAIIMLVFGFSFSKDHWILKTFFNFAAAGIMVVAVNTAKLISAGNNNLVKMGNVGITVAIIVLGIFFLYMFVYSFIEIIKTMKEKGSVRWNY